MDHGKEQKKYYNEKKQVREFCRLIKKYGSVMDDLFNTGEVSEIIVQSIENYRKLIPKIPYIGGRKNRLTGNLRGSAQLLSIIQSLENRNFNEKITGEVIYRIVEKRINSVNSLLLKMFRRIFFSKSRYKKWKKASKLSKSGRYKEDWAFDFIEGGYGSFDFGFDYHECGICKFYNSMGYGKYVPYLCLTDYAQFSALGIRMERTKTIGGGNDVCDFRFFKNGKTVQGWPPDQLIEFKNTKRTDP